MRKVISCIIIAFFLGSFSYAQTSESQSNVVSKIDTTGKVIPMNKEMFKKEIFDYATGSKEWKYQGTMPAILDFYADWCAPCRAISPIMKSLAKEYKGQIVIYKIDTDKEKDLATIMGIKSIPTLIFIPTDSNPQVMVGAASKKAYEMVIQRVLIKKKTL